MSVLVVFAVRKYREKTPVSIRAALLFVFLAVAGEQVVSHRDILNVGETPAASARLSLAWLKAYGVGAIGIAGPNSTEFWKPFRHPARFDGVLPALWSEDGMTIYQVPRRSSSLAHLVPESAVVKDSGGKPPDFAAVERYVTALEDASMAPAELEWLDRNRNSHPHGGAGRAGCFGAGVA